MRKFSHIGIPTDKPHKEEIFLEDSNLYVTDFTKSENAIEWLRFLDGSNMPEALKKTAHVAFEVDDLDAELEGKTILMAPYQASDQLKIAFILEDEAPVELMQYV